MRPPDAAAASNSTERPMNGRTDGRMNKRANVILKEKISVYSLMDDLLFAPYTSRVETSDERSGRFVGRRFPRNERQRQQRHRELSRP